MQDKHWWITFSLEVMQNSKLWSPFVNETNQTHTHTKPFSSLGIYDTSFPNHSYREPTMYVDGSRCPQVWVNTKPDTAFCRSCLVYGLELRKFLRVYLRLGHRLCSDCRCYVASNGVRIWSLIITRQGFLCLYRAFLCLYRAFLMLQLFYWNPTNAHYVLRQL